jgi:Tat protein translocase TatB subunit
MSGLPVLLFLDISGGELLVIMLVVFLVFGPDKMPEMARKAGRLMNQMKKASGDLTREFQKETSSLQNEITAVQSKVKDQVESVNREFNSTKSQVTKDMSNETSTSGIAEPVTPVEDTATQQQPDPESLPTLDHTTKTE